MDNALLYSNDEIHLDLSFDPVEQFGDVDQNSHEVNSSDIADPVTIDCVNMHDVIIADCEIETSKDFQESVIEHANGYDIQNGNEVPQNSNNSAEYESGIVASESQQVVDASSSESECDSSDPSCNESRGYEMEDIHISSDSEPHSDMIIVNSGSDGDKVSSSELDKEVSRIKNPSPVKKSHKLESITNKLLMTELKNMASINIPSSGQNICADSGSKSSIDSLKQVDYTDTVLFIASDSDSEPEVIEEVKLSLLKTIKPRKKKGKTHIKYFCEVCGKEFAVKSNMKRHAKLHFRTDRKRAPKSQGSDFPCGTCGKVLTKQYRLKRHMKVHEKRKKTVACLLCDKTFATKISMEAHLKDHVGEKPYECKECGTKFKHEAHMLNHVKIHAGIKPHRCDECGKCFIRQSDLKTHARIHTGEKPFLCTTCGKEFTQRGHLDNHAKIHTGIKPHVCDTCGRGFVRRTDMTRHIRTHTGDKPYICEVCGKSFGQSGQFLIHTRVHTGEKPYSCEKCSERFPFLYGFRQHQKICTSGEDIPSSLVCASTSQLTDKIVHDIVANME